jgi:hypothetical protein
MGGACSIMHTKFWLGGLNGRLLARPRGGWRIILKLIGETVLEGVD